MRREFDARPLLVLGAGLVVGLTSIRYPLNLIALVALLAAVQTLRSRALLAFGFVAGLALFRPPVVPLLDQVWVDGQASVVSMPRLYKSYQSTEVQVESTRYLLYTQPDIPLTLGDRIQIQGVAKPFPEGREGYSLQRGLRGRISTDKVQIRDQGPQVMALAGRWRAGFVAFCDRTLPPLAASLVDALCFNVDRGLTDETREALQRTGTAHIISASGLHVALFGLILTAALSTLPIPRSIQLAILIAILGLYSIAAGLQAPIVRSAVMSAFGAAAYLFRREADPLSALSFAAVLYLVWRPSTVFELGFHLSFIVVASLILFPAPHGDSEPSLRERASSHLRQALIATAATVPLSAYAFGIVAILAIPSNLLVATVLPFVMVGAIAAHAVGSFWPALAQGAMATVVTPLTGWISWIIERLNVPFAAVEVPTFSGYWLAIVYALALMLWRPRVRRA